MCTCVADRSQWELSTRDLKAEVWGVASDYENLMMNNNAKIVLCIWSTVFEQKPHYMNCELNFVNKSSLEILSGHLEEIEIWAQIRSTWG